MGVRLRELSPALGVEVLGVDLREEQPPEVRDAVVEAWRRHHLVLVRGDLPDAADHERFASWFGTVDSMAARTGASPTRYISNTRPEGLAREGSLLKHQDYCFAPSVLQALTLAAEVAPRRGGETVFVNSVRVYEHLPAELRARVEGLHARHVYDVRNDHGNRRFRLADAPDAPNHVHPIVLTHPLTGRPVLFVNELMTDSIVELAPDDGEALLQQLFAAFDDPSVTYRHRWQEGDVIVWDNIALQHGRTDIPPGQSRSLRRYQIAWTDGGS
jgi:alpha-ketoglutarate-dependent taurine dioxygenase